MLTFQEKLKKYLDEELKRVEHMKNGDLVLSVPPSHLYIEPTNSCNHRCIMCVPTDKKGKFGKMSLGMWKKIVDNMAENNIITPTTLIGRGEPLLHKDIVEIVDYGSKHDIPCYIITNGSLLTEERTRKLLDAGVKKIQVSMHAHSPESHAKITRSVSGQGYQEIKQNVINMVEIVKVGRYNCHTAIMSCIMKENKHEIEEFKKFWTPIVDRCFTTELYGMQGDSGKSEEAREAAQAYMAGQEHPGCTNPFFFLSIRWHGGINPCGYDWGEDMEVGNVNDPGYDMMKVFNNDMMQKLRHSMLSKDFSFCKEHDYVCETCDWPFDPDAFRGIDSHINNLPDVFSRNFSGALR